MVFLGEDYKLIEHKELFFVINNCKTSNTYTIQTKDGELITNIKFGKQFIEMKIWVHSYTTVTLPLNDYIFNIGISKFLFNNIKDFFGFTNISGDQFMFYKLILLNCIEYYRFSGYINMEKMFNAYYPHFDISFRKIIDEYKKKPEYVKDVLYKYQEMLVYGLRIERINYISGISTIDPNNFDQFTTILSAIKNFDMVVNFKWGFKRLCLEYDKLSKYHYLKSIELAKEQKLIMSDKGKSFLKAYGLTPFESIYEICEYGVVNGNCLWDFDRSKSFIKGDYLYSVYVKTNVGSILELSYFKGKYNVVQHKGKFNTHIPYSHDVCVNTDFIKALENIGENELALLCSVDTPVRGLTKGIPEGNLISIVSENPIRVIDPCIFELNINI